MPQICLYFQLHQPYRLGEYSVFDLGNQSQYFGTDQDNLNQSVFHKVSHKSYLPMLTLLVKLVKKYPEFHCTLSCSGIFLEQAHAFEPRVIKLLQELAKYPQVEFLSETYYHSLASLYSEREFAAQVHAHTRLMIKLFGRAPRVFRNTELIYSDAIASQVARLGFSGMLTEAVPRYLQGQPKTRVYSSYSHPRIPVLLKHAELSDDIAFRFSNRDWHAYPLSAHTYVKWLESYMGDELINLFMDFETFGEHQWEDTGIFSFFEHLVKVLLQSEWNRFVTPSQVVARLQPRQLPFYKVPYPISWADVDRDLSAWLGNELQEDTIRQLYSLEPSVLATNNPQLIEQWRRLQTSDHFYYMCIKWSNDGDVHAYFSPYDSPLDAYTRFSTVLCDLKERLRLHHVVAATSAPSQTLPQSL